MLRIEDLSVFYERTQALWNILLNVERKGVTVILGSNGVGKSTLLNSIAGLIPLASGKIIFEGNDISNYRSDERVESGISLVPEERRVFPCMTVRENLDIGAYTKRARADTPKTQELVFQLFPVLKERAKQLAGTLSGGEQQMLAIARGLMSKPKLLMLDEPSLGLSPLVTQEVFRLIREISSTGVTILLVEQNVYQALKLAERVFVLEMGRIAIEGTSQEIMRDGHIKTTYLGL